MFSIQEGEEIIKDFLNKVKQLPMSSMSENDALAEVKKLKDEIAAKNNPYIQDVLAKGT